MKVRVLHPLCGRFNQANFPGEEVEFPESLALEIIEAEYGELMEVPESSLEIETPEKNKKGRPKNAKL